MPSTPGRALVVDEGTSWSTLCAVRALARAGWSVHVGSPDARGIAASSRHVAGTHDVPSLAHGLDGFETALAAALDASGAEIVFGGGDAEVLALSLQHGRIDAVVPYPDEAGVRRAFDKLALVDAARRVGLATPATATEVSSDLPDDPVLVKSRWHWDPWRADPSTRLEAVVAPGRMAAGAAVERIRAAGGEPLVQEFVDGEHLSVVLLRARDGRLLAAVHQRIDHRWPVPAGWTVRAHTLPGDADLQTRSFALLEALDWTGLVELEFIRPADGTPRLIDFNGRFYGSMELAVAAGVDLPTLWADDATGRPVTPAAPARAGVRFQRFGGDLRHAIRTTDRRRVGAVVEVVGYALGARHSTLRVSDPRPALAYVLATATGRRRRP